MSTDQPGETSQPQLQTQPPPINSTEAIELALSGKTVAFVGLSSDPESASYYVASYLQSHGYRIIPVGTRAQSILGETSYPSLREVPVPVDVVDVFKRAEAIPPIAEEAHEVGVKVLWMPLGIANPRVGQWARSVGMAVVMNRCMKMEHMARHSDSQEDGGHS
jgi:predicted CoA-binding protein